MRPILLALVILLELSQAANAQNTKVVVKSSLCLPAVGIEVNIVATRCLAAWCI